jgi:hypothetical protein
MTLIILGVTSVIFAVYMSPYDAMHVLKFSDSCRA